ncbi:MAG: ABC transporter substrate-binding protein [Thermosphaera sp.]
MNKKILAGLTVIILIAIGAFAWFSFSRPEATRRIVIYAYNDRITGIDPSLEDDTGLVVLGSVYEPLVYYDPRTNEFLPALAVNWTRNDEGTEWIFKLREGVVFHDGSVFNASAVKLSIERARDIYRSTGRGMGYIWDMVSEIEILDPYTVKFVLEYPARLDLIASASYAAYIFSPAALEKAGVTDPLDRRLEDWFNQGNSVGTGPYTIEIYKPDSEVRLKKFDDWWGWSIINNPSAPDYVVIRILTEPQSQYNGLTTGDIDIASSIPRDYVGELLSRGYKSYNLTTYHNYILFFNTKRYPTNVTEFRKAIAHSINLDELVTICMKGFALKGSGIVPHYFPGHVDNLVYSYNLTKAREYLDQSNITTPVRIEFLYQVDYEENRVLAETIKSRLSQLGIEVVLNPQPWTALKEIAKGIWENPEDTPHLIIADWWPTIPSPYDYLYSMFHSESKEWNYAGYENSYFDELIDEAWMLEGVNYELALSKYKEAQEILFNEVIGINLWDEIKPFIYNPRIEIPDNAVNPLYMYVIFFQYVRVGQ